MTRLRRDAEGNPILHDSGQAVRVEDAAGNASWAPLANLPSDLSDAETAELLAVKVSALTLGVGGTLPTLTGNPASETQGVPVASPEESRATPLLPASDAVSEPAENRPPVITDESLRILQEAGVTLPPGSRTPPAPAPAIAPAAAVPVAPPAPPVAPVAPPAPQAPAAAPSRPGRRTQPPPADTPDLAQARNYRLLAEERAAGLQASLQFAQMANEHVAATRAAREQAQAAQVHAEKRTEGTTPGQLAALGCSAYFLGGILGWAIGCVFGASGIQLVGAMTLGQIALPLYLLHRRQTQAQRQQRRQQFLSYQEARDTAAQEADHVATH